MFLRRNKEKSEKNKDFIQNESKSDKNSTVDLKKKMAKSLLLQKPPPQEPEFSKIEELENQIEEKPVEEQKTPGDTSVSNLIQKINETKEKMISPQVDLDSGKISYPILSEIGESENNVEFLEKLTQNPNDYLIKTTYEKLLTCPQHPTSLSINVRLYCPKCNSIDVEKLYLVEHSKCGFIAEKKKFELSKENKITKCPQCKKEIVNESKEIHVPGMWHLCNGCSEKFDEVSLKLFCRKHNHDFELKNADTLDIPGFKIKEEEIEETKDTKQISSNLNRLLLTKGFKVENNYSLQGKSGQYHKIDIFAKNDQGKTVLIFLKKSDSEIDNSEINSKIIQVLDTSPNVAILIGFASISEKAKTIASGYNVAIIASQNPEEISSNVENILKEKLSGNQNEAKS